MQTFIQYLIEKRSNSDKNVKDIDPFEHLRKYGDDAKHVYISYTAIDKIGINPQSTYNTPNGIYTYQLDWVLKNSRNIKDVPFAGSQPHIWAITPSTQILRLNDYTDDDFDRDIEKLRSKFNNPKNDAEFDYTLQTAARDNNRKRNESAGLMWYFTKLLADDNPNKWNGILRDVLGYSIIRDDGLGIIHNSEPFQTVFLSTSSFKVLEKFNNPKMSNRPSDFTLRKTAKLKDVKATLRQSVVDYLKSGKLSDLDTVLKGLEKFEDRFYRAGYKGELLIGKKEWEALKVAIMNSHNLKYISLYAHLTKDKELKQFILSSPTNSLIYFITIAEYTKAVPDGYIYYFDLGDQIAKDPNAIIKYLRRYKPLEHNKEEYNFIEFGRYLLKSLPKYKQQYENYVKSFDMYNQRFVRLMAGEKL